MSKTGIKGHTLLENSIITAWLPDTQTRTAAGEPLQGSRREQWAGRSLPARPRRPPLGQATVPSMQWEGRRLRASPAFKFTRCHSHRCLHDY